MCLTFFIMNTTSILKLISQALKEYKSMYKGSKINRRFLRHQLREEVPRYLKGEIKDWLLGKEKKEKKPKRQKKATTPKEKKVKEYAILKMWRSMSEGQKKQFREWFRTKAMSQARVARSFNFEHELRKIRARVTRISNKYFVEKKKLTKQEWDFIYNFSEFFGDVDYTKSGKKVLRKTKGKKDWMVPRKKSSWIIAYRYVGESGKAKKGSLYVVMIRGKAIYEFPNFPYVEYIMLNHVTGSIGRYWWKKWYWRYSINRTKYKKYWYKGRPKYGK